jgi:hypothetical protein
MVTQTEMCHTLITLALFVPVEFEASNKHKMFLDSSLHNGSKQVKADISLDAVLTIQIMG